MAAWQQLEATSIATAVKNVVSLCLIHSSIIIGSYLKCCLMIGFIVTVTALNRPVPHTKARIVLLKQHRTLNNRQSSCKTAAC